MTQKIMPESNAIKMHLSNHPPVGGIRIFSGFIAALDNARKETGRNNVGQKILGADHGSWLGALGYMALLDQIGSCFRPKAHPVIRGNSIAKALGYFSNLNSKEISALYALRCAFAHDYSLYNISVAKPDLTHRFKVFQQPMGPVVTLPRTPWDGNFNNKRQDNETIVNLEAFGDLMEDICNTLFSLANTNMLVVALAGGSDELLHRYGIITRG